MSIIFALWSNDKGLCRMTKNPTATMSVCVSLSQIDTQHGGGQDIMDSCISPSQPRRKTKTRSHAALHIDDGGGALRLTPPPTASDAHRLVGTRRASSLRSRQQATKRSLEIDEARICVRKEGTAANASRSVIVVGTCSRQHTRRTRRDLLSRCRTF